MPIGIPDILGCYKGLFFGFETKLPEKRSNTSVMQERVMQAIRNAGGHAQVVCTPTEARDAMMKQYEASRRSGIDQRSAKVVEINDL